MSQDNYRTAVLSQFGAEALATLEVDNNVESGGHTPLGWGVWVEDTDSNSGTHGRRIVVDPRYATFLGRWCLPWIFCPKGQGWAREVLGDFS